MSSVKRLVGELASVRQLLKDLKIEFVDQKISQINLNANFVEKFEQVDYRSRQFEKWKKLVKGMNRKIHKQTIEINLLTGLLGAKISHEVCECGRQVKIIHDAAGAGSNSSSEESPQQSGGSATSTRDDRDTVANAGPSAPRVNKRSLPNIQRDSPVISGDSQNPTLNRRINPRSTSESASNQIPGGCLPPPPPPLRPRPVVSSVRMLARTDAPSPQYDIPIVTHSPPESNLYVDINELQPSQLQSASPRNQTNSAQFSVTYTSEMLAMSGRPLVEDPQSGPLEVINVLGRWDFQTHDNYLKNEKDTWKNIAYEGKGFLPSRRLLLPVERHSLIISFDIEAVDKKKVQLSLFAPNYGQNRQVTLPAIFTTRISIEGADGQMSDYGVHQWNVNRLNNFAEPNNLNFEVKNVTKKKLPKITFDFF